MTIRWYTSTYTVDGLVLDVDLNMFPCKKLEGFSGLLEGIDNDRTVYNGNGVEIEGFF